MDLLIADELNTLLQKEIKTFKHFMLDEDYNQFKDYDNEKWFSLFIYSIINDGSVLKQIKMKSIKANINQKDFNEFFYVSLKWLDKQERGLWSFHECTELNIPFENIKKLTLTYTII